MKVFLSWSGERSRHIAEALRLWLKDVIQALDPWVSATDIEKGTRWGVELATQLEGTRFGIICLTPENLTAPWVLFEAGALSKTVAESRVSPYLYGLEPSAVTGPLARFQLTRAEREDTRKLLHTLNSALEGLGLEVSRLDSAFSQWWPELERTLQRIPNDANVEEVRRSDREILEELLGITRMMSRYGYMRKEAEESLALMQRLTMRDLKMLWAFYNTPSTKIQDAAERVDMEPMAFIQSLYDLTRKINADSPKSIAFMANHAGPYRFIGSPLDTPERQDVTLDVLGK